MSEFENVDWQLFGRELRAMRDDVRSMRHDMDILIRSVIRLDQTVDEPWVDAGVSKATWYRRKRGECGE